jgi:hypothetical protein
MSNGWLIERACDVHDGMVGIRCGKPAIGVLRGPLVHRAYYLYIACVVLRIERAFHLSCSSYHDTLVVRAHLENLSFAFSAHEYDAEAKLRKLLLISWSLSTQRVVFSHE